MPTPPGRRAGTSAADLLAIVTGMSKSESRHPVRTVVLVALAVGAVVAYRNAVADKGGSYDPADAGQR
jgi:hypothetical protein